MKHLSFSYIQLVLALLVQTIAHAQMAPTGCAQARGPVLPWQDCQGAKWITSPETVVQTLSIKGPGCISNELPAATETCLSTNERRTVWLMFEVQPQPDGPTYKGAPAGQLRFSIVPADVDHQTLADDGQEMLGMTDYDFALFKVTDHATRADACAAIAAAKRIGTPGTPQVACNYNGLAGPTGMGNLGTDLAVDNQRYCKPLQVFVGDVFLLAVDNYSLNATYFRLLFDGETSTTPTARISPAPEANTAASASVRAHKACGYGLEVAYPQFISLDSIRTDAYLLSYKGRHVHPTSIQVQDADALRNQGSRLTLLFNTKIDTGLVQLEQAGAVADRYGRQQGTFTVLKNVRPPVAIKTATTNLCVGQGFKVFTTSTPGFAYGGWSASAGMGTGIGVLGGYNLLAGQPTTPGRHVLTYRYFWPEGCADSVSVVINIKAVPPAPALTTHTTGALEATLLPNANPQWQVRDSLFNAPALFMPSAPGSYRVQQSLNGCTSAWSQALYTQTLTAAHTALPEQVQVFPNPATDFVTVALPELAQSPHVQNPTHATLLNADGKVVLHKKYQAGWQYQLYVEHLPRGLYTLRVVAGNKQTLHRLVLQ